MARVLIFLLCLLFALSARAEESRTVATIKALVGNVAIQSANGAQRVAAAGGEIDNGDTVQTGVGAEIVMIFTDGQRVYLKPGSVFRVDDFNYAAGAPQQDRSFLSLVKGGLRAVDGLVAKQGKPENYRVKTPTSTIGIRGTEYSVTDCADVEPGSNANCKGEQIVVYDGQIVVLNQVDRQIVRAGEGTIVVSPRLPFGVLPASRVTPVVPSAACR
ncbi:MULTISPECIES: FecR family protein [unclassified Caballeronia]|uniref:FecR family protein n=1 Tax=unclassified Caballeronia TaxID=2646786 RepID=UPI00285FF9BB|nr:MULTISPECIES: FecR family protein [unclassified Caballeronia]MDR5820273.1 FecR family protein [Caballeronia sp. LZ043]MDR5878090.1 FecR family protein [Caballeronia sp. LZ032]